VLVQRLLWRHGNQDPPSRNGTVNNASDCVSGGVSFWSRSISFILFKLELLCRLPRACEQCHSRKCLYCHAALVLQRWPSLEQQQMCRLVKYALLVAALVLTPFARFAQVQCRAVQDITAPVDLGKLGMVQLTYHGPVPSGREAVLIVLHILLKAKRQTDGSYSVRTVAYAERPALQGIQRSASLPQLVLLQTWLCVLSVTCW